MFFIYVKYWCKVYNYVQHAVKRVESVIRCENNKILLLVQAQVTKWNKNWQQHFALEE
jgi:hypothetical protein